MRALPFRRVAVRGILIRAILGAAVFAAGGLAAIVVLDGGIGGFRFVVGPAETADASPSPTPPVLISMKPSTIQMAADANCAACHVMSNGQVGVKAIPAIAHPLDGWRSCTACHTNDSLVQTAPGHSGIHASDCLVCHTVSTASAPPRTHPAVTNTDCLSCHGTTAPLPHDMNGRPETECWICHRGPLASPDLGNNARP